MSAPETYTKSAEFASKEKLVIATQAFLKTNNVPADHGWDHAMAVVNNAINAMIANSDHHQYYLVVSAALLHDVDDMKFFQTTGLANARSLLNGAGYTAGDIEIICEMISLVRASSTGSSVLDSTGVAIPLWKFIPRDADRLEALGWVGVERCHQYTVAQNLPIALETTQRPVTDAELAAVGIPARFAQYVATKGTSASMIDHFYDKLLEIDQMSSGNVNLQRTANGRRAVMVKWLFRFNAARAAMTHPIAAIDINQWK